MKEIVIVLTLLLVIASSIAQLVTYSFPEDRDITICPAITPSSSQPNFRLEPASATQNERFLVGTYDESDMIGIPQAEFDRENSSCTNNSAFMCSKLSLRYGGNARRDRGFFIVTYTASNGVQRRIRVNFGYVGVYLQDESAGPVVGRVPNTTIALNNSLVVFGTVTFTRLAACFENGMEANNLLRLAPIPISNEVCSGNNQTNSQPGLFKLTVFLANRTGEEKVYFVDADCSGARISDTFLFIFDPPSTEGPVTTVTTEMTIATPATTPTGKRLSDAEISIIAVVVGVAFVVVVIAIIVVVYISYQSRRKRKRGAGSRTSSTSSADTDGRRPSPIMNLLQGQRISPTRGPSRRKKLFIVKNDDSYPTKPIAESLHELNSDLEYTSVPVKNGKLPEFVSKVVKEEDRVIILGDGGELHQENTSQQDELSLSRKWIHELERPAAYTRKELRNVFLVLFGNSQDLESLQRVSNLPRIPVSQRLDGDNLDTAAVAKVIQDQIEILLSRNEPEGASTPNLSTRWENSSTDLKRKVNGGATPTSHLRVNELKDQPGTESGSDISTNSLTHLIQTGFKDIIDATNKQGQMTRNALENEGQMTRSALENEGQMTRNALEREGEAIQGDLQVLHGNLEQVQTAIENQSLQVTHPYPNDPTQEQPHISNHGDVLVNYDNNQDPNEGPPRHDPAAQ